MTNKEVIEYVQYTPHNTNPAILKQKLEQQDFENRPDWNQNDPTAVDYVKNRPFYSDDPIEIVLLEATYTATKDNHYLSISDKIDVSVGEILNVEFDGVLYECEVFSGEGEPLIGNGSGSFGYGGGNGEPFCFWNAGMIWLQNSGTHTIKIVGVREFVHQIPAKYIPPIGTKVVVWGYDDEVIPTANIKTSDSGSSTYSDEVVWDVERKIMRLYETPMVLGGKIQIYNGTSLGELDVGHIKKYDITNTQHIEILSNMTTSSKSFVTILIIFSDCRIETLLTLTKPGVATALNYNINGYLLGIRVEYTDTSATVNIKRLM